MKRLLLRDPMTREAFETVVRAEGFSRSYDAAFTGGARTTNWSRGEDIVALISDSPSGAAMLIARGPNEALVVSAIGASAPLEAKDDVIRAAGAAKTPIDKIRGVLRLGLVSRNEPADAEVCEVLKARLLDADKPVRWAAMMAAFGVLDPSLDEAVAESARRHADMVRGAARWIDARREDNAAKRKEEGERVEAERLASLPVLLADGAFFALVEVTAVVMGNDPKLPSGYFHHALALSGLGRPAAALPFLRAAMVLARDEDHEEIAAPLPQIVAAIGECLEASKVDLVASLGFVRGRLVAAGEAKAFVSLLRDISAEVPGAAKTLSLALAVALDDALDEGAAEAIERAVGFFPEHAGAAFLLAESRARKADFDGAVSLYLRALALVDAAPSVDAEAARAEGLFELVGSTPGAGGILSTLMSRALDHRRHDVLLDAAERAIARDADDVFAFRNRAVALTFLERHEAAIAAYGEALVVMDRVFEDEGEPEADPRGLMRFNRACEFARLGRRGEALADLAAAVEHDESWGKKARKDTYFCELWADPEFRRIAAGFVETEPTPAATHALVERCLGHFFRGEADEALEVGEEAEAAAEVLGDPALLSDARKTYGNALTYLRGPAEGIPKLESAVELAKTAFSDKPARRAEAWHLLGAAYHAARDWEKAEACYRAALEDRQSGLGEAHFQLAKSYGDMARLEADRGLAPHVVAATIDRGRALLRGFLAGDARKDDRIEALFDLATLSSNLGVVWLDAGEVERALAALEEATDKLEAIVAAGRRPSPNLTKSAASHVLRLAEKADEGHRARAAGLSDRLFVVLEPSPRVRVERMYWATLRVGARELVARGISPASIAAAMREAMRGGDMPEPVRSHPAFHNLALELATRLSRRGDIILVAMALSTAMASGELDAALDQLEGLAIAEANAGEGVIPDDEED